MVRTKDKNVKVAGAKAPRKLTVSSNDASDSASKKKYDGGGNPYHPRDTPAWQKPITSFFATTAGSSGEPFLPVQTSSTNGSTSSQGPKIETITSANLEECAMASEDVKIELGDGSLSCTNEEK